MLNLYDTDFYSWTQQQAALLRMGNIGAIDIDNLIEEIEDMGISQWRALESRLIVLLAHLLKWIYEPEYRSNSWEGTIRWQRSEVQTVLQHNPGLKHKLPEIFKDAYKRSRIFAMKETGLKLNTFPLDCPWNFTQVMDDDFWLE